MQSLYDTLLVANGIIFGTPIYFYSMTAQAKAVIDRTISFSRPERSLANKVGGVIAVAGSMGLVDALKDIYFYFVTRQILPANYVAAYPGAASDIREMKQGMEAARQLGRQMVQIAAKKFEYPGEFRRASFAYGTHTR